MKVAMISRSTLFSNPGGDTVQMLNTAKCLTKLGVEAVVKTSNEKIDYNKYDLLHFFNIIRPADILPHIEKAKLPYVVSPIFVDYSEYEKKARQGLIGKISQKLSPAQQEYAKLVTRSVLNGEKIRSVSYLLKGHHKSVKQIIEGALMLLPNSENEYKRISAAYGTTSEYRVVPNAVDENIFINKFLLFH